MDTKYKSSYFATYLEYIVTPLIVGIYFYEISIFLIKGVLDEGFYLMMLPMGFWICILAVVFILKSRYVKVRENNLLIKTLINEEILEYKDIEWINQNIFDSSWYILSIKYKDSKTGKYKVIFVFPEIYTNKESISIFNFIKELNVTKYIREQIIKANPAYKIENEPSRWFLFIWICLSAIPFILVSFFLI